MTVTLPKCADVEQANVTALATYYFPQRQAKRDAFLERIGRGLQKLGQELTDNGDALVLP